MGPLLEWAEGVPGDVAGVRGVAGGSVRGVVRRGLLTLGVTFHSEKKPVSHYPKDMCKIYALCENMCHVSPHWAGSAYPHPTFEGSLRQKKCAIVHPER